MRTMLAVAVLIVFPSALEARTTPAGPVKSPSSSFSVQEAPPLPAVPQPEIKSSPLGPASATDPPPTWPSHDSDETTGPPPANQLQDAAKAKAEHDADAARAGLHVAPAPQTNLAAAPEAPPVPFSPSPPTPATPLSVPQPQQISPQIAQIPPPPANAQASTPYPVMVPSPPPTAQPQIYYPPPMNVAQPPTYAYAAAPPPQAVPIQAYPRYVVPAYPQPVAQPYAARPYFAHPYYAQQARVYAPRYGYPGARRWSRRP